MINDNVVELTRDLVAIPSETDHSNEAVCDFLQPWLESNGFMVERLSYMHPEDTVKVNLVAKKGAGAGEPVFFPMPIPFPETPVNGIRLIPWLRLAD